MNKITTNGRSTDSSVAMIGQELDRHGVWPRVERDSGLKEGIVSRIPDAVFLYLRRGRSRLNLLRAFYFDYHRFTKSSSTVYRGDTHTKLAGLLTLSYHNIEKGLSLPKPRPLFGRRNIRRLVNNLHRYLNAFG